jgi:hypothetical protein
VESGGNQPIHAIFGHFAIGVETEYRRAASSHVLS